MKERAVILFHTIFLVKKGLNIMTKDIKNAFLCVFCPYLYLLDKDIRKSINRLKSGRKTENDKR